MATDFTTPLENTLEQNHTIERAKYLLNTKLDWLSPSSLLHSKGGRDFGRSIESSLIEVSKGKVKCIQLRKRDTAVVMSIAHYEELIDMKKMYSVLVSRLQELEIAEAADAYEMLYQRITSPTSKRATDNLFSATGENLRATYQPGTTETK